MTLDDDNRQSSGTDTEDAPPPPLPAANRGQLRQFIGMLGFWRSRPARPADDLSVAIDALNERAAAGRLGAQGLARLAEPVPMVSTRPWMPITAFVLLAGALAWWFVPRPVNDTLPDAMLGAWKTANVGYSDRQIWLAAHEVAFQQGPTTRDVAVHRVIRIDETAERGDTVFYRIVYDVDGSTSEWPVALVASGAKALQFVNQRDLVWTPAGGAAWPR